MLWGQDSVLSLIEHQGGTKKSVKTVSGIDATVSVDSDGGVDVTLPNFNGFILILSFSKFTIPGR